MEVKSSFAIILAFFTIVNVGAQPNNDFPYQKMPDVLPGTKPLTWQGDLSVRMLDGAHKFIDEKIQESISSRAKLWSRDLSSAVAYEKSVEPNRRHFMTLIGVEDRSKPAASYNVGLPEKHPDVVMEKISTVGEPEQIAETDKYVVYQVRWPVLNRVYGEGILLQPKTKPVANVIAIPDADQSPEQLAGLSPGVPAASQFARHLAENGFQVLIPVLVSRTYLFEGKSNQQTYREWLYRQAFHMGRHLIGYEVQKVLAAVDWFEQSADKLNVGVAGYNEGGLIAFCAAAVDTRIDASLVSGYFTSRQRVWDEPLYRNVWRQLSEFGDAEVATLIAPRPLIIEHSSIPEVNERIVSSEIPTEVGGWPFTGYKGKLQTPSFESVNAEYNRIDALIKPGFQARQLISGPNNSAASFGSQRALEKFTQSLGSNTPLNISKEQPVDRRKNFDKQARQIRQVKEIEDHVQWLLRDSDQARNKFFLYSVMPEFDNRRWSTKAHHPYYSPEHFVEKGKEYRKIFREETMGSFDDKMLPPNPQTRKILDKERWTGFEVVLDVYPNFFATGVLLIPKDLKPGNGGRW
jgi:hypothetical protein